MGQSQQQITDVDPENAAEVEAGSERGTEPRSTVHRPPSTDSDQRGTEPPSTVHRQPSTDSDERGAEPRSTVHSPQSTDSWSLAGLQLRSRVLLGSSGYPGMQTLLDSIDASGAEVVTVAVRRVDLQAPVDQESLLGALRRRGVHVLPNTAGCYTAREAVLTAQLAREALGTDLVKLEVIGDDETLYPDAVQLLRAAEELIGDRFRVLAYCGDDPVTARKLADLGCDAVMPLAAPIGSGMGILNPYALRIIREMLPDTTLVVDAGIGTASDAARAMELGYDGVLLNTAVAGAKHPATMAAAMARAVEAGRLARSAGRVPRRRFGRASSPAEGRISINPDRP